MKCRTCTLGEHYLLYPMPGQTDDDEPIHLVQCPFGEKAFHLEGKRCSRIKLRRELEGSDEHVEEISETDRCEIDSDFSTGSSIYSTVS